MPDEKIDPAHNEDPEPGETQLLMINSGFDPAVKFGGYALGAGAIMWIIKMLYDIFFCGCI